MTIFWNFIWVLLNKWHEIMLLCRATLLMITEAPSA